MADDQPFLDEDDPSPVGDSDELHDEIHSVDLPPDHPSQGEVKRREGEGEGEGAEPSSPADAEPRRSG